MMKRLLLLSALCATITHNTKAEKENLSFSRVLTHEDTSHVISSKNDNSNLQEIVLADKIRLERQLRGSVSFSPTPDATPTHQPTFSQTAFFQLTVKKGSGSGAYKAGTNVQIAANDAPDGKVFSKWTIQSDNSKIDDLTGAKTSINTTAENTLVTATYKNWTISESTMKPTPSPSLVVTLPSPNAPPTAAPTSISSISTFALKVEGGIGSGNYTSGTNVTIKANQAQHNKVFEKWVTYSGNLAIADEFRLKTVLTMPAEDVIVKAAYKEILYKLSVNKGSGSGNYTSGTNVTIKAKKAQRNKVFEKWVTSSGNLAIADEFSSETVLTMPADDVFVTAAYKEILYELSVNKGSGGGNYTSGTNVTIKAKKDTNLVN